IRGLGAPLYFLDNVIHPKSFPISHVLQKDSYVRPSTMPLPLETFEHPCGYDRAISLIQEDIFTPLQSEVEHQHQHHSNSLRKRPREPFDWEKGCR
ncbi:uncharacterized, partial [Tachysurus ichikawai]